MSALTLSVILSLIVPLVAFTATSITTGYATFVTLTVMAIVLYIASQEM